MCNIKLNFEEVNIELKIEGMSSKNTVTAVRSIFDSFLKELETSTAIADGYKELYTEAFENFNEKEAEAATTKEVPATADYKTIADSESIAEKEVITAIPARAVAPATERLSEEMIEQLYKRLANNESHTEALKVILANDKISRYSFCVTESGVLKLQTHYKCSCGNARKTMARYSNKPTYHYCQRCNKRYSLPAFDIENLDVDHYGNFARTIITL